MSTTDFQDEEISLCERSPSLGPSVAESSGFGAWTWRLDGLYELIGDDTSLNANGMNELHIMI